jgi:ribose/xylose/arabinose/galactoside ABC-type transport system permease subunit
MSGVDVGRSRIAAFTLAGIFAAIGGLYLALQTGSGNADVPQSGAYTLNSIAAAVIGGILIVLLASVLSVMQMPEAGRQIIYGTVIIVMLPVYGRGEKTES